MCFASNLSPIEWLVSLSYTNGIWSSFKYLTLSIIFLHLANILITPRPIKNLSMVQTRIPILNGLEVILPKPKTWIESPCLQFARFAQTYGEVYQIKFGTRLIVIANSYASIKQLWCSKNVKGNNSRPVSYSFHKVLSKGGIYTIGTTPMGDTYKKARKHVSERVLSEKRNKEFNYVIIDKSSNEFIESLLSETFEQNGKTVIKNDMLLEAQYFHLKIALWLTYGFELNVKDLIHKSLADEIIYVENRITKVRSHIQNCQDYLPSLLQRAYELISGKNTEFQQLYISRQKYLGIFHEFSKNIHKEITMGKIQVSGVEESLEKINHFEDLKNTLMFNYFNEENTKVNIAEVTSECLTMVSAGLDNTPLNFKYGLHMLCNYHPQMWQKAYEDLLLLYNNDSIKAFENCSGSMDSKYVLAIVEETLRLFTVLPLALPRETTSEVIYKNAVIPSKTTLFMNCWAGNHDPTVFPEPMEFRPERWLTTTVNDEMLEVVTFNTTLKHFAFGVGCRKCLGANFAKRELYTLFAKLILKFEPLVTEGTKPPSNPLQLNLFPESLAIEPLPFDIFLQVRDKVPTNRTS